MGVDTVGIQWSTVNAVGIQSGVPSDKNTGKRTMGIISELNWFIAKIIRQNDTWIPAKKKDVRAWSTPVFTMV